MFTKGFQKTALDEKTVRRAVFKAYKKLNPSSKNRSAHSFAKGIAHDYKHPYFNNRNWTGSKNYAIRVYRDIKGMLREGKKY